MSDLAGIQKYLEQKQLAFEVVDLDQEAFTVRDVVRAGIKTNEIVKTLVVRIDNLNFVALVVRGNDRLDFKKIRKLFGSKTELAKPEEVLKVVGVSIGAVCPVKIGIPVYLDKKVLELKNVHMGSGDLKHGLEMKLSDLLKAIGDYQVVELI